MPNEHYNYLIHEPTQSSEREQKLERFYAREITDPNDSQVDLIYETLSHPDNAPHLVDQTETVDDVKERIGKERMHVLAINDHLGNYIATATIEDGKVKPYPGGEDIQVTRDGIYLFAVKRDLQSDMVEGGKIGTRAFESVLKHFFEDSKTYNGEQRESGFVRIIYDIKGAVKMVRICLHQGARLGWPLPQERIIGLKNRKTGKKRFLNGQEYVFSFFNWIPRRLRGMTDSLDPDTDPIPDDAMEYYVQNKDDYERLMLEPLIEPH